MKTKNLLTRISFGALFAAAALLPAALTSCSSNSEPTPVPDPVPNDGLAHINFSLSAPELATATRAETDVTTKEGTLTSLWIYFFQVDGDNSTCKYAYSIPISGSDETNNNFRTSATLKPLAKVEDSAKPIIENLAIEPATYRIYVLANLDERVSGITPSSDCSGIAETAITGPSFDTTTGIIAKSEDTAYKLPMAAGCKANDKADDDGNVSITSGSVTLTATLSILCSKVRYTFFFDNVKKEGDTSGDYGYSWPYQSCSIPESNALQLLVANQTTSVFGTPTKKPISTDADKKQYLTLTEKGYPADANLSFWLGSSNTGYQSSLPDVDSNSPKHAYQGLAYFVEDPSSAQATKTCIQLTTNLGVAGSNLTSDTQTKTFTMYLPKKDATMDKGNYYDIVGKITGSGELEVKVRINDWAAYGKYSWDF